MEEPTSHHKSVGLKIEGRSLYVLYRSSASEEMRGPASGSSQA